MKFKNIVPFLLVVLSILVSGCGKAFQPVGAGEDVIFSGGIQPTQFLTRASYGGDSNRYNKSSKTYEPIYWSEGDVIKIYCNDGDTKEIVQSGVRSDTSARFQADYVISEVTTTDHTKAKIELNSSTTPIGLRWGDNKTTTYEFYAVYPAYKSVGKQITRSRHAGINEKAIYCNLYDVQNTPDSLLTVNDGNYTLAPNMKWMLMCAQASYKRSEFPSDGSIFLNFQPLTTAIQFTITNSTTSDMVINKLQLISDSNISGSFQISDVTNKASDGFPNAQYNTSALKQVTQDFTSSPVTLGSGKTFTFTFFLAPIADVTDANKLRFRITRGDGSTMTTRLCKTDGTYISFPRCKKSFIKGIMVPEGVQWYIDYEPVLTDWEADGGESITLK